MKILHTSDWHLGKTIENRNRIDEQAQFIEFLSDMVKAENVDLVLIAGDIFDTYNPSAAAERLFYHALSSIGENGKRVVLVIAGNHDNPERLCAANPLANHNNIILLGYPGSTAQAGSCVTASGPGWLELHLASCGQNAVVLTMPYPSEMRLEEVLFDEQDEKAQQKQFTQKIGAVYESLTDKFRDDTVNLAIGHYLVMGGEESDSERTISIGGALSIHPDALPNKAQYIALGHLHRPQRVKGVSVPVIYCGSPLAYSFSESEHAKAVYLVTVNPGENALVSECYLTCGKPLRRWTAKNGFQEVLQWCREGRDIDAWVDLEIFTDKVLTKEELDTLRQLHSGILNIRPRFLTEKTESIEWVDRENKKIDVLFNEYYQYRTGIQASEDVMAAFVELMNDDNPDETGGIDT